MKDEMNVTPEYETNKNYSRRKFLGYAGGIAGAGLLIASCTKEEEDDIIRAGEDTEAIKEKMRKNIIGRSK